MNKNRRQNIYAIIKRLNNIIELLSENVVSEYIDQIADLADDIQCIYDEEYEYMDNIPENLQYSERYEKAEEACDLLEEAASMIYDIEENDTADIVVKIIKRAIDNLSDAT